MGSLFYIDIPTRHYEIGLRQREFNIWYVEDEPEDFGLEDIADDRKSRYIDSSYALFPSTPGTYGAVMNGKKAELLITGESIVINPNSVNRRSIDATIKEALSNTFMEKLLEDTLKKFQVLNATWGPSIDGNYSQITFCVHSDKSEKIITHLTSLEVGKKYESILSVCSAIVYFEPLSEEGKKIALSESSSKTNANSVADEDEKTERSGWNKFVDSIKARLTVAQVVQAVGSNASLTFDFLVFVIVAATIASLGLLEDSPVNLVASMLISPMMGPILAGIFGMVIRDKTLIKKGVVGECIGLSMCLFMGFLIGLAIQGGIYNFEGPWHEVPRWPTGEMIGRSKLRGIVVGAMVAIPSGAGVALSILAGNAGSLVGVAISASLLPPAVNCGLLLGMAAMVSIKESYKGNPIQWTCNLMLHGMGAAIVGPINPLTDKIYNSMNGGKKNWTLDGPDQYWVNYRPYYCCNIIMEYIYMAICSFGLTLINIILIVITAILVLKIKEVAPNTSKKDMARFWREDVKVMRNYNKTHRGGNAKRDLLNDIKNAEGNENQLIAKLSEDAVYTQINRRTLYSPNNLLEDKDKEEDLDTEKNSSGSSWFFDYFKSNQSTSKSPELNPKGKDKPKKVIV